MLLACYMVCDLQLSFFHRILVYAFMKLIIPEQIWQRLSLKETYLFLDTCCRVFVKNILKPVFRWRCVGMPFDRSVSGSVQDRQCVIKEVSLYYCVDARLAFGVFLWFSVVSYSWCNFNSKSIKFQLTKKRESCFGSNLVVSTELLEVKIAKVCSILYTKDT